MKEHAGRMIIMVMYMILFLIMNHIGGVVPVLIVAASMIISLQVFPPKSGNS